MKYQKKDTENNDFKPLGCLGVYVGVCFRGYYPYCYPFRRV